WRWLQEEDSRDVQCLESDSTDEEIGSRLDMDAQKLETEKLRKGKNKAEGDLDSLKTDYKRLHCSMKAAGLGKTSEQWCQEIQD
ncbi:hypothetical protein Gotur_017820, partial [Gossypium turneri]